MTTLCVFKLVFFVFLLERSEHSVPCTTPHAASAGAKLGVRDILHEVRKGAEWAVNLRASEDGKDRDWEEIIRRRTLLVRVGMMS